MAGSWRGHEGQRARHERYRDAGVRARGRLLPPGGRHRRRPRRRPAACRSTWLLVNDAAEPPEDPGHRELRRHRAPHARRLAGDRPPGRRPRLPGELAPGHRRHAGERVRGRRAVCGGVAEAVLAPWNPAAAAEELRRAVGRGLSDGMLPADTAAQFGDAAFDAVHTTASELDVAVAVHPRAPTWPRQAVPDLRADALVRPPGGQHRPADEHDVRGRVQPQPQPTRGLPRVQHHLGAWNLGPDGRGVRGTWRLGGVPPHQAAERVRGLGEVPLRRSRGGPPARRGARADPTRRCTPATGRRRDRCSPGRGAGRPSLPSTRAPMCSITSSIEAAPLVMSTLPTSALPPSILLPSTVPPSTCGRRPRRHRQRRHDGDEHDRGRRNCQRTPGRRRTESWKRTRARIHSTAAVAALWRALPRPGHLALPGAQDQQDARREQPRPRWHAPSDR